MMVGVFPQKDVRNIRQYYDRSRGLLLSSREEHTFTLTGGDETKARKSQSNDWFPTIEILCFMVDDFATSNAGESPATTQHSSGGVTP